MFSYFTFYGGRKDERCPPNGLNFPKIPDKAKRYNEIQNYTGNARLFKERNPRKNTIQDNKTVQLSKQ